MCNVNTTGCAYCGASSYVPHSKYSDRCAACGKRYAKYANYRWLQKHQPTSKRDAALQDIIEEYRTLQRRGFKVPKDIAAIN